MGTGGPLTAAEQVAILDRQLEESTRDFDGIIYDEEQRQREAARERAARRPQTDPITGTESKDEEQGFKPNVAVSNGGVGTGTSPPPEVTKYPVPEDIPELEGGSEDIIARQLYEAATREPNPERREKLWNEYRKLMGIESQSK